jgi:hypothetical protein
MKRWSMRLAIGASCVLVAGIARAGERTDAELAEMRSLVEQLKEQVDAQAEQIEHQGNVIQESKAREEEREGRSGLDDFFTAIEIGGWVATSWWYNFNDPPGNALAGANTGNGSFYPFHPDSNSFEVDQVWFEIEKPVSEESRAGFRLDMDYGLTAGVLSGPFSRFAAQDSASDFNLYQAYVQYLIPVAGGVTLRAGKFGTLLGAEVAQTVYNFNVTRGDVYNLLQPITNYGVILDGETGPVSWHIGGVNNGDCCGIDPDNNGEKSLLVGASVGGETFSVGTSLQWGIANYGDSGGTGTVDVLVNWNPTERFSSWVNFDYKWAPGTPGNSDPWGWGIAVAGRLGLTDTLGFAVRGEVLQDNDQLFGIADAGGNGDGTDIWSITGTLDWTIYENLVAKAEIRYDAVVIDDGNDQSVFINRDGDFMKSDQVVGGIELTYQF